MSRVFYTWLWTVLVENLHVCRFDFNDSFTVLTIIVRKLFILQNQSFQKYWIVQSHPNNSFKLFDNYFPTCFHTKLCSWKLMHRIRTYANTIHVRKCLMYTVSVRNIVWQYTVSGNCCLCCMSLYWYRKHDLYALTAPESLVSWNDNYYSKLPGAEYHK